MKKCINCGTELIDSAKFCSECGTKQELPKKFCIECGEELTPEAKFCINCGTPVNVEVSGVKNTSGKADSDHETVEELNIIQPIKGKNEFEKKIEEIKEAGGLILYPDEDADEDYLEDILTMLVPEFKEELEPTADAYSEKALEAIKSEETKWKKFGEPGKDIQEYGYPDDEYEGKLEYTVIDQEILVIRGEGNTFRVPSKEDQKSWEENFWVLNKTIQKIKNKIKCVVIISEDTSVRARVFKDFKNLEFVIVCDEVTGFRRECFYNCPIKLINFPEKLAHIVTDAFKGGKFKYLFFEPIKKNWSDLQLDEGAFTDCKELKYVFLPKSIIEAYDDDDDEDDDGLDLEDIKDWFEEIFSGCDNLNTDMIWDLEEIKPLLKQIDSSSENHENSKKTLTPKSGGFRSGFVDEDGNFIIEPKLVDPANFSEGLASYYHSDDLDEGCGYIDEDGNMAFKNVFAEAGEFSEEVAMVWPDRDDPRGFIDKHGKWLIKPDERFWDGYNAESKFIEGIALVFDSDKKLWGWINKKGEYVIDPIYEEADNLSEGLALVKEKDAKYGFINKTGKYVLKPQFEEAKSFQEGVAPVNIKGKWGYIDHNGKTVIEPQFKEAEKFTGGLAIVKENKKYGLIDKKGDYVASPVYDSIEKRPKGLFKVGQNKKFGYIDSTGKEIIPAKYDSISDFCNGVAAVESSKEYYYIDLNDKIAIKPKFDSKDLSDFSEGVAVVKVDGKYGYIDLKGNWIAKPQFSEANAFCKGLGRVELETEDGYKEGYIKRDGSYLGGKLFDNAGYFYQDRLNVKLDEKWGCIDREGNWIVKPEYVYLSPFFKDLAQVTNDDHETGYIDLDGNLVREMVDFWDAEEDEFDRKFEGALESYKDDDDED